MDILYVGKTKTSICGTGICHVENEGSIKVAEVPVLSPSLSLFLHAPARTARFTRRPWISGLLPEMTSLVCMLLLHSFVARAAPLQGLASIQEEVNGQTQHGEPSRDRTIFTIIAMVCMMVVSVLLGRYSGSCCHGHSLTIAGSRASKLRRNIVVKRSLMSTLVLILYILVLMFIICSAVLVAGQGLYTRALCVAGTWSYLMFYTFIKGIM